MIALMNFNQITLVAINSGRKPVSLSEFSLLAIDRPAQSVVFSVPDRTPPKGVSTGRPGGGVGVGVGAGASVRLTTDEGEAYEGFVEITAEASDGWVYWCGVCFEPIATGALAGAKSCS